MDDPNDSDDENYDCFPSFLSDDEIFEDPQAHADEEGLGGLYGLMEAEETFQTDEGAMQTALEQSVEDEIGRARYSIWLLEHGEAIITPHVFDYASEPLHELSKEDRLEESEEEGAHLGSRPVGNLLKFLKSDLDFLRVVHPLMNKELWEEEDMGVSHYQPGRTNYTDARADPSQLTVPMTMYHFLSLLPRFQLARDARAAQHRVDAEIARRVAVGDIDYDPFELMETEDEVTIATEELQSTPIGSCTTTPSCNARSAAGTAVALRQVGSISTIRRQRPSRPQLGVSSIGPIPRGRAFRIMSWLMR